MSAAVVAVAAAADNTGLLTGFRLQIQVFDVKTRTKGEKQGTKPQQNFYVSRLTTRTKLRRCEWDIVEPTKVLFAIVC